MHGHCTCGIDKDGNTRGCGRLYFIKEEDRQRWAPHCSNVSAGAQITDSLNKECYVCECHVTANQKYSTTKKSGPPIGSFEIGPLESITMQPVEASGGAASIRNPSPWTRSSTRSYSAPTSRRKSATEKKRETIMGLLSESDRSDQLMEAIDAYVDERVDAEMAIRMREEEISALESKRVIKAATARSDRRVVYT